MAGGWGLRAGVREHGAVALGWVPSGVRRDPGFDRMVTGYFIPFKAFRTREADLSACPDWYNTKCIHTGVTGRERLQSQAGTIPLEITPRPAG